MTLRSSNDKFAESGRQKRMPKEMNLRIEEYGMHITLGEEKN
jgi:hypothetical protein